MTKEEQRAILIVDDNISQCVTLSLILRHKGYSVETAKNGLEAIEKVQIKPFDMILMDIKMPILNGVETYRRIKNIRSDTLVIMMTAYVLEDLVREALAEGAYAIVHKPFDIEKLITLLEEMKKKRDVKQ